MADRVDKDDPSRGTAIELSEVHISLPSGEQTIQIDIQLQCPACGPGRLVFPVHHVRLLAELLTEIAGRYGDAAGIGLDEMTLLRQPPKHLRDN